MTEEARSIRWSSVGSAAGATAVWSWSGLIWALMTPKFEAIFLDFGVALPVLTRVSISAHRSLASFGSFTPLLAVGSALVVLFVVLSMSRWWVSLIVGLLGFAAGAVLVMANFMPLTTMIESLQQGGY